MANTARDIIWPTDPAIVLRVVMLHVGQGSSNIVLARQGESYQTLLSDINLDEKGEGIDVPKLMTDLLDGAGLDVFCNSHPHNDHLCGVPELSDAVTIRAVWHSGHEPGKDDRAAYDELKAVIDKVTDDYGEDAEVALLGSQSPSSFGEAEYYVLAPAKHICDDLSDETEEERRKRIHEQCAVLKFGIPDTWVMLPGDADRDAWEKNILPYHNDRAGAQVMAAIHHGSRSFFKKSKEDTDSYLTALETINPDYVVVSAPKRENSRHEHPHEDALSLYADQVGEDNLFHTGENLYSYIIDVFDDGTYGITDDAGQLAENYPFEKEASRGSNGQNTGGKNAYVPTTFPSTRIDQRPMGSEPKGNHA